VKELLCRLCSKPLPREHIVVPRLPDKRELADCAEAIYKPKPGDRFAGPFDAPVPVDRYCPQCYTPEQMAELKTRIQQLAKR
jgi:hypothetical protein